jgi:hypothetical protein
MQAGYIHFTGIQITVACYNVMRVTNAFAYGYSNKNLSYMGSKKSRHPLKFTPKPPKTDCYCPVSYCGKLLTEYELFRAFCTGCRNSFKLVNGEPGEITFSNTHPNEQG